MFIGQLSGYIYVCVYCLHHFGQICFLHAATNICIAQLDMDRRLYVLVDMVASCR